MSQISAEIVLAAAGAYNTPMWMHLRAWWYQRFVKNEEWPLDVRRHVFQSGVEKLERAKSLITPARQEELATKGILAAFDEGKAYLDGMRGDILADAAKRLDQMSTVHCTRCDARVFAHEAVKKDAKFYCQESGARAQN